MFDLEAIFPVDHQNISQLNKYYFENSIKVTSQSKGPDHKNSIKYPILTYKMKLKQHEDHLKMFEQQFLIDDPPPPIRTTEENLIENNSQFILLQNFAFAPKPSPQKVKPQQQLNMKDNPARHTSKHDRPTEGKKKYKFVMEYFFLEIIVGYAVALGLMRLNSVVYFPFFEALFVLILSISTQPINITNSFILLGIPTAIANYNLQVWVLTYPEIVILYFSSYLFTNRRRLNLLWIVNSLVYLLFGFVLLQQLGTAFSKESRIILYYLYPWLLAIAKVIIGLVNHVIFQSSLLLLQISLFFYGLSYGMLLTLAISSIEFWYLLVLLTLQIINNRYQFLLGLAKKLLKRHNERPSILEAQISGYNAINCFHLIGFIYIICVTGLNTANFNYSLSGYLEPMQKPAIVWIFFTAYQVISVLRLRRWQNLLIVGYESNTCAQVGIRGIALSLGLFFFYLGLGIPSKIFAK